RQKAYRVRKAKATQQHLKIWHRHLTDARETPASIFNPVQQEFGITLDVCADAANTKVPHHYFSPDDDGLSQDWGQEICWMNPPFSQVRLWLRKALDSVQAGATVICLVKHTPGVGWWRELIPPAAEVRALGRVRFVGMKHQAPFDAA